MTERILKSVMIGVCVFLTTIIIAYLIFSYVYQQTVSRTAESLLPVQSSSAAEPVEAADTDAVPSMKFIARLTDNTLSIYASTDNREAFLYNLNVRIEDISEEERTRLREGIELSDRQALASFEEDFTS